MMRNYKFYEKEYTIESDVINKDITIALFSDIHFSHIFDIKKLEIIKTILTQGKPNYICIPGDILDYSNVIDTKEMENTFLSFFQDISTICPIYIALGNHDTILKKDNKLKKVINNDTFHKLAQINNIHILDNTIQIDDQIRFIGITLSHDYYYHLHKENEDYLIKEFNHHFPNIHDDKFNILLCHSPRKILNKKCIQEINDLKNINLILSGHMHNGLVPHFIDKLIPNSVGLISPSKRPFPVNARGKVTKKIANKQITLIITGGITKIQEVAPKSLQPLDNLFASHLDFIKIKKK